MIVWILNRKKLKAFSFLISILVYTVNMALISICIRFSDCILAGMRMDWYRSSVELVSQQDVFFVDKAGLILTTLMIVFSFMIVFSILVVWGYRKLQLTEEVSETAQFLIQGYPKGKLWQALAGEAVIDLIISLPFAFALSEMIEQRLCGDSMFRLILTFSQQSAGKAFFCKCLPLILLAAVFMVQASVYLKKYCKNGLARMLRGG